MDFRIKSILIWPKDTKKEIRQIEFQLDKINVITGGSEKGKSAMIAIIDYCLGSSTCRIPTRRIRDKSEWFGILISLEHDIQLLLVREEPKDKLASGEMYMKEGKNLQIPALINANCNVDDVKNRLNNLANLSDLNISGDDDIIGFESRPSFRDLTSFIFQPQYIIANQSTLFYRADSMAHREKLKNIFPYIFKAVDNKYLELKDELKNIERKLNSLEREKERNDRYIQKWIGQLRGFYNQAKEFGLLKNHPYPNDTWKNDEYLAPLREIAIDVNNNIIPRVEINGITKTSNRLADLTSKEIDIAHQLNNLKHRQELIKRILDSNRAYRNSLLNQDNRLTMANWFQDILKKQDDLCPFCGTETDKAKQYVTKLIETKNEIIEKGVSLGDNYSVLSGEFKKVSNEIDELIFELNNIRAEIEMLRAENKDDNLTLNTLNNIYLFAGKLDAEISQYDALNKDDGLVSHIQDLSDRKLAIEQELNSETIRNKINRAKRKIADGIKFYANIFLAENRDELIEFNDKELTINFITSKTGRKDALYEIGSGHNYLAYHIATILSMHEFFINNEFHPVPNFIVFDQPTQVYFPESDDKETSDNSDDILRVKRIFEAFQKAIERTKGKLQILVLEHVGPFAWEGYEDVVKIKRWRNDEEDNALIPSSWL